jgi:hypothetical protein
MLNWLYVAGPSISLVLVKHIKLYTYRPIKVKQPNQLLQQPNQDPVPTTKLICSLHILLKDGESTLWCRAQYQSSSGLYKANSILIDQSIQIWNQQLQQPNQNPSLATTKFACSALIHIRKS